MLPSPPSSPSSFQDAHRGPPKVFCSFELWEAAAETRQPEKMLKKSLAKAGPAASTRGSCSSNHAAPCHGETLPRACPHHRRLTGQPGCVSLSSSSSCPSASRRSPGGTEVDSCPHQPPGPRAGSSSAQGRRQERGAKSCSSIISCTAHNWAGKGTGELRAAALARPSHGCLPGNPQQAGEDQGDASPPPCTCGKPRRGVKTQKRSHAAGKRYSIPDLTHFTPLSYFKITASQSNGCLTGLVFSHPVSPPRRFGDKQHLTTCKKPQALSPYTPSTRPSEGRGKPQPYRHALRSETFHTQPSNVPGSHHTMLLAFSPASSSSAPPASAIPGCWRGCWLLPSRDPGHQPRKPGRARRAGAALRGSAYPLKPRTTALGRSRREGVLLFQGQMMT